MRPMARFSMLDGKLYPAAVFLGVDSLKLQSLDFWGSLRSASSLIRRYGCPLFQGPGSAHQAHSCAYTDHKTFTIN